MADHKDPQLDPSDNENTISPNSLLLPLVPSSPGSMTRLSSGVSGQPEAGSILSPGSRNPFTKSGTGPGQSSTGSNSSPKSPNPLATGGTGSGQPSSPKPLIRGGSGSGKHPVYRGIRMRSGKWVSEVREPRKTTRIWLGTYPTPEMAAAAYDVAAMTLKGVETFLNFRDRVKSYPLPKTASPADIREAAASAASLMAASGSGGNTAIESSESCTPQQAPTPQASGQEYMDEEEFFNLPNLLVDMAEGMLMSPPKMRSPPSDDDSGDSDGESLWSYV